MSLKGLVLIALILGVVAGLTLPGHASKPGAKPVSRFQTLALS